MNDMRMAKFETFIEEVDLKIKKSVALLGEIFGNTRAATTVADGSSSGNTALALIYDYNMCNDYAKFIMDKSTLFLNTSDDRFTDVWKKDYPTYEEFKDAKKTIEAANKLVRLCRTTVNFNEGYKFIFWALMILTVDKTDAEEHLALICDYAKMLTITEDEFEDIIQIVKIVYNEVTEEYMFKSENIPSVLGSLFINIKEESEIKYTNYLCDILTREDKGTFLYCLETGTLGGETLTEVDKALLKGIIKDMEDKEVLYGDTFTMVFKEKVFKEFPRSIVADYMETIECICSSEDSPLSDEYLRMLAAEKIK